MPEAKSRRGAAAKVKLKNATEILTALGFGLKQSNELAGYVLLALLDLKPTTPWSGAGNPLRGSFMTFGPHRQTIPTNAEYSVPQIRMLVKQVETIIARQIRLEDWEQL